MKADPSDQLRLLDVQQLDSRADQLNHQRRSLPEIVEMATLTASKQEVDDQRRKHHQRREFASRIPRF